MKNQHCLATVMITFDFLKNHPQAIPQLVYIWHELLGKNWAPEVSMDFVEQRFQAHLHRDKMPLTVVAFDGDKPVGMCSLRENDGILYEALPWLGSLVVTPEYQKQGIAKQLIKIIKDLAQDMAFKELYLFTFDPTMPDYYRSLNWEEIKKESHRGHLATVMKINL